uniref:Uncharacterized protein n=1 Tax=Hyaloperonospora arabidopsidis (strain Emoy2) TaxID=559515 RepID=M4BA57_HYAAE
MEGSLGEILRWVGISPRLVVISVIALHVEGPCKRPIGGHPQNRCRRTSDSTR